MFIQPVTELWNCFGNSTRWQHQPLSLGHCFKDFDSEWETKSCTNTRANAQEANFPRKACARTVDCGSIVWHTNQTKLFYILVFVTFKDYQQRNSNKDYQRVFDHTLFHVSSCQIQNFHFNINQWMVDISSSRFTMNFFWTDHLLNTSQDGSVAVHQCIERRWVTKLRRSSGAQAQISWWQNKSQTAWSGPHYQSCRRGLWSQWQYYEETVQSYPGKMWLQSWLLFTVPAPASLGRVAETTKVDGQNGKARERWPRQGLILFTQQFCGNKLNPRLCQKQSCSRSGLQITSSPSWRVMPGLQAHPVSWKACLQQRIHEVGGNWKIQIQHPEFGSS